MDWGGMIYDTLRRIAELLGEILNELRNQNNG